MPQLHLFDFFLDSYFNKILHARCSPKCRYLLCFLMFSSNSPHHTFQPKCKSIVFPVVLSRSCIYCIRFFWVHWVGLFRHSIVHLQCVGLETLRTFFSLSRSSPCPSILVGRLMDKQHKTSLVMILKCIHIYIYLCNWHFEAVHFWIDGISSYPICKRQGFNDNFNELAVSNKKSRVCYSEMQPPRVLRVTIHNKNTVGFCMFL